MAARVARAEALAISGLGSEAVFPYGHAMRLICGLCHDLRFGDLASDLFVQTIREHLALHRRAGDDPVTRLLSPTSFVLVARGEPDGYLEIGGQKLRLEIDFGKASAPRGPGKPDSGIQ
jgi:hypothetical protein